MNTLYVDFAGGKFEPWFHVNNKRKFVEGPFYTWSEVQKYIKNSPPFERVVLTQEAELFKRDRP